MGGWEVPRLPLPGGSPRKDNLLAKLLPHRRVTLYVTLTAWTPTTDHAEVLIHSQVGENLHRPEDKRDIFFPAGTQEAIEVASVVEDLILAAALYLDPAEDLKGGAVLPLFYRVDRESDSS